MDWYLNMTSRETWACVQNAFTPAECDLIIEAGKKIGLLDGRVGDEDKVKVESRKSKISFFNPVDESIQWIFRRTTDFVNMVNKQFWNYDLSYIETLQFTSYTQKNDFYGRHTDQANNTAQYRKLSFSVQLSDPNTYKGSDLLMHVSTNSLKTQRDRGTIIFFPSFTLHEVTPLLSGKRYSLVGWVCGPPFK